MTAVQDLYKKASRLFHLGEDGSPIYADELSALNAEVDQLSALIFGYTATSLEDEAELCRALLLSFAATYTSNPEKNHRLNEVLDRVQRLLSGTTARWPGIFYPNGLIRSHLSLFVYTFLYDEDLLAEVGRIIHTWEGRELTKEEAEIVDLYGMFRLGSCSGNYQ